MQFGLPLAGSGVRGIRFLLELKKSMIKNVSFNDYDKAALNSIKKNLALNEIKSKKVLLRNDDANLFLLNSSGFDYIDIDPFGSPNAFLDSSIKRISRDGILAITATDTSALCGTYAKACKRKYWATPLRNEIMHEIGLRILIRKCQLIGSQFDKALIPLYSYSKDHYMRVFFSCHKGKSKVDAVLKQHGTYGDAGPLWLGALWDSSLASDMADCFLKKSKGKGLEGMEKELYRFLESIKKESLIDSFGFYEIPALAKKYNLKSIPKQEYLTSEIMKRGYKVSETHFVLNSLRSDISERELVSLMKK